MTKDKVQTIYGKFEKEVSKEKREELKKSLEKAEDAKFEALNKLEPREKAAFHFFHGMIGWVGNLFGFVFLLIVVLVFGWLYPYYNSQNAEYRLFSAKLGDDLETFYQSTVNYGYVEGEDNFVVYDFIDLIQGTQLLERYEEFVSLLNEKQTAYNAAKSEYNAAKTSLNTAITYLSDRLNNYDNYVVALALLEEPSVDDPDYETKKEQYDATKEDYELKIATYTAALAAGVDDEIAALNAAQEQCKEIMSETESIRTEFNAYIVECEELVKNIGALSLYGNLPNTYNGLVEFITKANETLSDYMSQYESLYDSYRSFVVQQETMSDRLEAYQAQLDLYTTIYTEIYGELEQNGMIYVVEQYTALLNGYKEFTSEYDEYKKTYEEFLKEYENYVATGITDEIGQEEYERQIALYEEQKEEYAQTAETYENQIVSYKNYDESYRYIISLFHLDGEKYIAEYFVQSEFDDFGNFKEEYLNYDSEYQAFKADYEAFVQENNDEKTAWTEENLKERYDLLKGMITDGWNFDEPDENSENYKIQLVQQIAQMYAKIVDEKEKQIGVYKIKIAIYSELLVYTENPQSLDVNQYVQIQQEYLTLLSQYTGTQDEYNRLKEEYDTFVAEHAGEEDTEEYIAQLEQYEARLEVYEQTAETYETELQSKKQIIAAYQKFAAASKEFTQYGRALNENISTVQLTLNELPVNIIKAEGECAEVYYAIDRWSDVVRMEINLFPEILQPLDDYYVGLTDAGQLDFLAISSDIRENVLQDLNVAAAESSMASYLNSFVSFDLSEEILSKFDISLSTTDIVSKAISSLDFDQKISDFNARISELNNLRISAHTQSNASNGYYVATETLKALMVAYGSILIVIQCAYFVAITVSYRAKALKENYEEIQKILDE